MDIFSNLYGLILSLIVLIFSIIIHEVAHGYAAYMYGDETASLSGRLTLNPLPHIDILGSIIVPIASVLIGGSWFGWAKPVPYNPHNLQGKYAEAVVASAGVITNFFVAVVALIILKVLGMNGLLQDSIVSPLLMIIGVNISLAFFNLIPVPPFDGMSIITAIFPRLRLPSALIYNPIFMIVAILVASSIFSAFAPYIFSFIERML